MTSEEERMARIFRSMGEPSWWALGTLAAHPDGLAPFEIIRQVQDSLKRADYPIQRLDPGTLHYALPRMEELGVIEYAGERDVDVPVGRGATKRDKRPVWIITALGQLALVRRDRLLVQQFGTKLHARPVTI